MITEQTNLAIKKNDQVQVIAGREKGKIGKVLRVDYKSGRIVVEKINMVKKHTRPSQKSQGGITEKETPLHYSNVLLVCSKCNRGTRHGRKLVEKTAGSKKGGKSGAGKMMKIRVCKRCGSSPDAT